MTISEANKIVGGDAAGGSLAFILEESSFHPTGYKVLQSFHGQGLVSAQKSRLNGKLRLVYDLAGLHPLSSILPEMLPDAFLRVADSLTGVVMTLADNGFIQCDRISLAPRSIYINPDTMSANLIYVPLWQDGEVTGRLDPIESALRDVLLSCLTTYPNLSNDCTRRLAAYLQDPSNPVSGIRELCVSSSGKGTGRRRGNRQSSVLLLKPHSGGRRLAISTSGAVIGRDPSKAQMVISENSISRAHCRIYSDTGTWYVEDLGSKNGTFYNGHRLLSGEQVRMEDGGELRLSVQRFTVETEGGVIHG